MDTWLRDVKQTFRMLRHHRGFAAAALVTIALGVGGTAAVFSIVYAVLLRPLPYPEPERLVRLWEEHPGAQAPIPGGKLSGATYRTWAASSSSFEAVGAFSTADFTVSIGGTIGGGSIDGVSQRLRGTRVTPSLFRVLRVSPFLGRLFDDADAEDGAQPVVVLSHGVWRDRFGSDPNAIGRTLTIDGVEGRIIGVAPAGFAFPEKEAGLRDDRQAVTFYTPMAVRPRPNARVIDHTEAIGRLAPGVTMAQAAGEGTAVARRVDRPLADLVFGKGQPVEVRVRSIVDQMTMQVRPALLMLAAGVTLVLLIACANVANLFLSRGSDRVREIAVRATLGASRARLVRQLITESACIAAIGGALGVFVGWALTAAVPALAPADFPRLDEVRVDATFVIIAIAATIVAGVVSGIVPALKVVRADLTVSMQSGARTATAGLRGARTRRVLLAIEAALAVVLLVSATLAARSFAALMQVDAGYEPSHVLTADVRLPATTGSDARKSEITRAMVDRLRGVPGVRAAGAGDMAPFGSMISVFAFKLPGVTGADGQPLQVSALRAVVTPGYAEALGLRLKEGRWFGADDAGSAIRPIVVNETFARRYIADTSGASISDRYQVSGRTYRGMFPGWLGPDTTVAIVGIVEDVLPAALDARPQPQIFVAQGGRADIGHATLVVKTDGDPASIAPTVKDIVRQIEPGATVERMGPLSAKVSASVAGPRFSTFVLAAFAILALLLAATGLYGVLSYSVAQRRREIAVRAALGATWSDLLSMVMREGLQTTAIGLAIGVVLAAGVTRAMASALFGVAPLDAIAFTAAPALLLVVACAACLIPARRAIRVDPAEAFRAE